ncbi:MAG: hypothetical protein IT369_23230, partial [Candidatus Latescibacteria bacterium]|nr:hypothetical protein [Candidatus Latescibacterota bacterium]
MSRPHPRVAILHRPLSVHFELCLAATAFFLWCLAASFGAKIGISLQEFRLVVDSAGWQPQWPVLPWVLAVGGLVWAYSRHRWGRLAPDQTLWLGQRLRQLTLLTGALLLLRLGTLWSSLTGLFPYLTLLWSPHATWALSAAFLLFPQAGIVPVVSTRRLALGLFLASGLTFSLWALYFCQMTMLHGDEAHYLRVTQSLLRDGDMDLSNNLGPDQVAEYHVLDFQPHRAPGSPPGKIHSVHPIGLSALLAPAYWSGLQWWGNPRLACSLAIAWCSAGVLTLAFLWLMRLGFRPWTALACTLVGGSTTPFFLYTPQLYPEIPALLITLLGLLLLSHWQALAPVHRSWGNQEPYVLAGLEVLLFGLLFLHPRYLPLALFLGAGIGLQVWHSPQRWPLLRLLLPLAGAGLLALVAFNYAYSRDPFGPFLPGNAWDSGALQASTLVFSLPGQWLHSTTGLLNCSPVYLASLLGLVLLASRRDRRAWGALTFYLVTAGVNGLHPDWTFGFCPPARYLLTALPVLLFGLAFFVETHARRLLPLFGLLFALMLSYDSIACAVTLPEQAFGGNHLGVRTLNEFYPFDVHFFSQTTGVVPWADLAFWLLATASMAAGLLPRIRPSGRWAGLLVASLLPLAWGQAGALTTDLNASVSPYLRQLDSAGRIPPGEQIFDGHLQREYQMTTGQATAPVGFGAQAPPNPAGILKSYYAPLIQPGVSAYWLTGLVAQNTPGEVAGHLVVGQRQTVPALSDWGVFHAT